MRVFLSNTRCGVGGAKASGALVNRRLWRCRKEGAYLCVCSCLIQGAE